MKKLRVITLILSLILCASVFLVPLAKAEEYDTVCFAGAEAFPTWSSGDPLVAVPDVFNLISATVSFSSQPVPQGVFNFNWIGANSYNPKTGDVAFFQICLVSPPSGNKVGLNWLVDSNKEGTISGSTDSLFSGNMNLYQKYDLAMYYNGTGWILGCNGVQIFYFDWANLAFNAQFTTETWFNNGVIPNIGTSDFTNCQVGTLSGYIPLFALSNPYKATIGSSTYSTVYPMYNGAEVLSDSSFQTGFGYPNDTETITAYQGQDNFSSTPYFGLNTNFLVIPPTTTPTASPSSNPTSYPTLSPTSWPSSNPSPYPINNSPLAFILENIIVIPFLIGAILMGALVVKIKFRKHRR